MQVKKCTKCHEWKPLSDFTLDKQRKSGRKASCRACNAAGERRRYVIQSTKVLSVDEKYDMFRETFLPCLRMRCCIGGRRLTEI